MLLLFISGLPLQQQKEIPVAVSGENDAVACNLL
jgi:hypothetical protein